MDILPLTSSIGAQVLGVDLREVAPVADALRTALLDHGVLFVPAQSLTEEEHRQVASIFGDPTPHPAAVMIAGNHVAGMVTNDAERPPRQEFGFHNDYSFSDWVPAAAVLQALVVPSHGGDTIWVNMLAAYEALSPSMQTFLVSLHGLHTQGQRVFKVLSERLGSAKAEELAEHFRGRIHPLVVRHPVSERPVLFLDSYTERIVELTAFESDELLRMLRAHLSQPRFHCRYHWHVGDVAIWDEVATGHQAPFDFGPETRIMRRVTAGLIEPLPFVEPSLALIP
jgi:taurine dioxygenase